MFKLFIVGISRELEESELAAMFSSYGTVLDTTIIRDRNSGESRGYGFVDLPDLAAAEAAINSLNGTRINGRLITVRLKDDREGKRQLYKGSLLRGIGAPEQEIIKAHHTKVVRRRRPRLPRKPGQSI
jgi:cold-inducible RNA-binding protein